MSHAPLLSVKIIAELLDLHGLTIASVGIDSTQNEELKLVTDSRRLSADEDAVFIAYKGASRDANDFVTAELLEKTKLVIVESSEAAQRALHHKTAYIQVKDGRRALSVLMARAYDNPEKQLKFWGVTGTNGKTSVTLLLRELLSQVKEPVLSLGTVGAYLGEQFIPLSHTTPPADELFALLSKAVTSGIKHVLMEVSSHAIVQERLGTIRFDGVAFTSFSRDHLDFHPNMEAYFHAKWQLIETYRKDNAPALICDAVLEQASSYLKHVQPKHVFSYALSDSVKKSEATNSIPANRLSADLSHAELALDVNGSQSTIKVRFFANHAIENLLAAIGLFHIGMGYSLEKIDFNLLSDIPGRLERVFVDGANGDSSKKGPVVIVDYAHTPDAVSRVLAALKPFTKGKLIVVFGCGGDRDKGKRPEMAAAAGAYADYILVTSDNPRTEDPLAIISEIVAGLDKSVPFAQQADRALAIKHAIDGANRDDVVAILGKGHEDYQIIGLKRIDFDDREYARNALQGWRVGELKVPK